ncbi:MFS transporter [Streptococcus merionis]|uniref:MFS transporter n=1 Tax=Streptococcus merionis TaxID=400065 RepID=UPI0026F19998|nr:MFS transporter [Streptococcus merionis]
MQEKISYLFTPMTPIHKKVFLCFLWGQISCGYTLSIAGTALAAAEKLLGLNSFWVGLLGAATLIGLFGSLVIGPLADKIGRKFLFQWDMVLFAVLSMLQFFVSNPILLFIIRVGLGIAIAIDYTVGSALLTEWLPEKESPKYQSYLIIFWMAGFVASYIVGLLFTGFGDEGWRWIIASSAVPTIIASLWRFKENIPESPAWLASVGRLEEANTLIQTHIGPEYEAVIPKETKQEKVSWSELFSKEVITNTLTGCIFWSCQVFPFFGLGIFFPILAKSMNMGNSIFPGLMYNLFTILGAVIGVIFFNRISRRSYLIWTFYIAAIALAGLTFLQNAGLAITLILFSVVALVLSASTVAENPYPAELFDTRLRGSGIGFVIAISRIGSALGTFLMPVVVDKFGVSIALGLCVIVLMVGGVYCQLYAPETSPNFAKKAKP